MIKVFLDDDTEAEWRKQIFEGYDIWVTTPEEVIELLKGGNVSHISLDHDLALEPPTRNGQMVTRWIEEQAYLGTLDKIEYRLHTQNPRGFENMKADLISAGKFWKQKQETGLAPGETND